MTTLFSQKKMDYNNGTLCHDNPIKNDISWKRSMVLLGSSRLLQDTIVSRHSHGRRMGGPDIWVHWRLTHGIYDISVVQHPIYWFSSHLFRGSHSIRHWCRSIPPTEWMGKGLDWIFPLWQRPFSLKQGSPLFPKWQSMYPWSYTYVHRTMVRSILPERKFAKDCTEYWSFV